LLQLAAKQLPSDQQDRFLEEWRSLLTDMPSPLAKLVHSFSIVFAMRRLALLREIEPRFRFGVGDVTFYFALKRGVVAFEGSQPIILKTKEEAVTYLRRRHQGQDIDEGKQVIIDMMWAIYESANLLGVEPTLNCLWQFLEKEGKAFKR
jgi:hypothetical protein